MKLFYSSRIVFGVFLFSMIFAGVTTAQNTASIRGLITDFESGDALPGVQIYLQNGRQGAITDVAGHFEIIKIAPGQDVLIAKFVGYETITKGVSVSEGQSLKADFEMVIQPIRLQGIAVSATRERQNLSEIAASIGVIDRETIADMNPSHPSAIMGKIPGVWVNSTAGEGHMTAIRQPLSTAPLYLYLENGIPTRSTGFFNHNALYEINIPQASSIEVIKGPGTALYGSDAIGGVINVSSGIVPSTLQAGGTIEGGSYGYKRALLTAGTTHGMNGIRFDLNVTDSEGWRDNTEYSRLSATLRWDRRIGSRSLLKTVVAYSDIDQEPAGASAISEEDYRQDATLNYTPVSFRKVTSFRVSSAYERYYPTALLSITPFVRFSSMDLLPNWALTFDPATWEAQNLSFGAQLKLRRDYKKLQSRLIVGADLDYSPGERQEDEIDPTREGKIFTSYTDGAAQYDYDVTYQQASPFVHAEFTPARDVRVTAGLRLDVMGYDYSNKLGELTTGRHRRPGSTSPSYSHASPKFGVTYQATDNVNTFFSYRHAFRVPSERQLFRQGSSINSIDLKPVKVDNFEAGVRGQLVDEVTFDVTAFTMTKRDDIVTFVFEDGSRGSVNSGKTSHEGLEVGLGISPVKDLTLSTAYSYTIHTYVDWETQLGENLSGNEMEVAPRVVLNAELSYRFPIFEGATVGIEWNRLGNYWTDPENTSKYSGHDVFNIRTIVKFANNITLLGRIGNVTDELYAERVTFNRFRGDEFAPGSPRTVNISLRYGL